MEDIFQNMSINYYRQQMKFGQGNVFRPVCHSVDSGCLPGGGSASRGGLHPGASASRGQNPAPSGTMGYSQRAGGTHPTGMLSC